MLEKIIKNADAKQACVIWMHGLGADGHDFESVVSALNLPHIKFILPHAPYRAVTLNNGYEMRAWYDIYGLTPQHHQDAEGIRTMQAEIVSLMADEIALGTPAKSIVLAGFSQGGAMALHTATRYSESLAGVLALSTYLPLHQQLADEYQPTSLSTPIWMAHGVDDAVIILDKAITSRDALTAQGYKVDWHTYDMAHSVSMAEISDIRAFLLRVLPK